MENIKFTSDGKKVIVIGSLNSQEKIVQEIFIIDGSEIPSGEHFVTKSLHDQHCVSWKEQELKKIEEKYETSKSKYEREIKELEKSYRQKAIELRAKIEYIGLSLKNANESSFNTFVDYITGEIEWVVVNHYDFMLLPINEFNQMYEDQLRLISIFGKDNGSFTYAVGDYYDWSGGHKYFTPFKNYNDAFDYFKQLVISDDICEKNIEIAKKYNFELDKEKLEKWKSKQIELLSKNISSYETKISEWKNLIENI